MRNFISGTWADIKGNAKWDIIKWVLGGSVVATGYAFYALFLAASVHWRVQILIFVVSVLAFAGVSVYQRVHSRNNLEFAHSKELAELASVRAERDQLKQRFDLSIKTSDIAQQENRRLRDQLGQTEERVEQILLVLKQAKLECDEIYADVILGWLRDHIHTTGMFSISTLTKSLDLPEDSVRRGLGLLKSKYQLVSQLTPDVDMWAFVAASSPLVPKYKMVPTSAPKPPLRDRTMTLRVELQDFGPKPEIEATPGMKAHDFIAKSREQIDPWYNKLKYGYEQRFAERVRQIYWEYGELNMLPLTYNPPQTSDGDSVEDAIQKVIERLGKLADSALGLPA
jgi:hypothetical protein